MQGDAPSPTATDTSNLSEVEQLRLLVQQQQATIAKLAEQNQHLAEQNQSLSERISDLEAEIAVNKKLKGKPKLKASRLNKDSQDSSREKGFGKRPGSNKRSKKSDFAADETRTIEPPDLPAGAKLNQYREYDVQELELKRRNIRFRLGEYILPDGSLVRAELPKEYSHTGHYGPVLVGYILHEHYHNRVPQPLIYEQLQDWGIDISTGQVNRILNEKVDGFHQEQASVLQTGIATASYIHTDDTGARQNGKNGYCTVIGNDWFSYFASTRSKSRVNFLSLLQAQEPSYVLNEYARQYLEDHELAQKHWQGFSFSSTVLAGEAKEWEQYLSAMGIVTAKATRLLTEAALLGGLLERGVSENLLILSDGAGQFNLLVHALCWVHAERTFRKLEGSTAYFRENIEAVQTLLWDYYQALKAYRANPTLQHRDDLYRRFDESFGRCYIHHPALSNALAEFRKKKDQLLRVLDFPAIPLHNNAAESDIREFVVRRKISGGTRSELGRRARDTMVGLKKTCRKLGICFWDYLLARLRGDPSIAALPELIRRMAAQNALHA